MKSHVDVINAFGGTKPLAEAIGVKSELAIHWHKRGIPAKYWADVEMTERGRELGITAILLRRISATGTAQSAQAAA